MDKGIFVLLIIGIFFCFVICNKYVVLFVVFFCVIFLYFVIILIILILGCNNLYIIVKELLIFGFFKNNIFFIDFNFIFLVVINLWIIVDI